MSLFNFVAVSLHASQYFKKVNTLKSQDVAIDTKNISSHHNKLLYVKVHNPNNHMRNYYESNTSKIAAESIYRFSKLNNLTPGLWQELINRYWQQTIFLSISNPTTQKYINQLSKQEILLSKNKKKKLLLNFTKALLYGHIETNSIIATTNNAKESKEPLTVKYIWKKGLNIKKPKYWNGLWQNQRTPNFPNKFQNILLTQLQSNQFPIFTVINGFKQLIVAEPANELIKRNNIGNSLYEWYYDRFLWNKDIGGIYEGWFFINYQDAEEYKNYIADKYATSTKQNKLAIMFTGVNFYYRLNRTAPPKTEFRLFPDLEEVANLLTKKAYRNNIIFDKKQNYGRYYFQGQPIYMIEPMTCKIKNSRKSEVVNYYYQTSEYNQKIQHAPIFFNKETALLAWKNFYQSNSKYHLPSQPILRVYNLEDFLKDQEQKVPDKFLFIPSQDSYQQIKSDYLKEQNMNSYQSITQNSSSYFLTGKLWLKRIIWSLTSRQPPNW